MADDAFLLAMLYALPDPVVGVDAAGCVCSVNGVAADTFGFSEAEARGKPLAALLGVDLTAPRSRVRTKAGALVDVTTERVPVAGEAVASVVILRVGGGADLSPRLRQTLEALCEGLSERDIAAKLGLSQHTVHGYVKDVYRRFGVQSRAALVARVLSPKKARG